MTVTASTINLKKSLRQFLLDYQSPQGGCIRDTIVERCFDTRARDTQIAFPYVVYRLQTRNNGENHGMRRTGALEIQVIGRPWAQQEAVSGVADLIEQAMLVFLFSTDGLVLCHGFDRYEVPPAPTGSPIDSEVCTIRLSYTLAIWPTYLTQLTTVLT